MDYRICDIINGLRDDPVGYVDKCDGDYEDQVQRTADEITRLRHQASIVLLTGPSGSGKTTTAIKLAEALKQRGVGAVSVSMDCYFIDYDPDAAPRTPEGDRDMESPLCLDLELMGNQFRALTRGEEILIPSFDFTMEKRHPTKVRPLRLDEGDVAIFEGINALNDMVTEFDGVKSYKIYVSVDSGIYEKGHEICSPRTVRLLRRMIRDHNYRGASPEYTFDVWKNVIRGEELYIEPNRTKADVHIDTFTPYELSLMKFHLLPLIDDMEELKDVRRLLERIPEIDESIVPPEALVREFIGGSEYKY